jgi:LPS-assembly protein
MLFGLAREQWAMGLDSVRGEGIRMAAGAAAVRRTALNAPAFLLFFTAIIVVGCWSGPSRAQTPALPAIGVQPAKFPTQPKTALRKGPSDGQMLVQAGEIHYDYANERVSAVGNVQIYHEGSTLEADRVVYDQKTKRLRAEGNARLTEANGQVTYGEIMDLSDDYRDGFVDSLRVDAAERTSIAAARVERSAGNYSVFHSGVYTACEPCKDDPKKPPLWQVKAARIIHDQSEKMMYFEDARLEFFGVPAAYFPFFSAPDPTVKRKTGFLMPTPGMSDKYGSAINIPFFWAIAPDYDLTLNPTITSKQGVLMDVEWRQRLSTGAYSIRAMGIRQADPSYFVHTNGSPTPGHRTYRGSLESFGQFSLSSKWNWGWDIIAPTDKTFLQDYNRNPSAKPDLLRSTPTEGISQLYLSGRSDRSYFDARSMYFYGFSESDVQGQIPIVHPVMDYTYTFGPPVFGGELGYRINTISLSRDSASFDPIATAGCAPTADPASRTCLLRGFPGNYSRFSAETTWRRSVVDSYGQVFTPFAVLRADLAALSVDSEPGVEKHLTPGDSVVLRAMPTIGMEYRYPFIGIHSWGTQTIEPIAQVIVRPNETNINKLPNEDAQSLIFDDSNLFKLDKFSGWDRAEGGGRANVGAQYTAQFNNAGSFNVLVGQSYQLFGKNSFAQGSLTNTGLDSGLDTARSDYIARASYQPNRNYALTSRFRFDKDNLDVERFELEGRVVLDRWSLTAVYGNYAAQPALGFLTRREGILGTGTLKLTPNWSLTGTATYDVDAHKLGTTQWGLSYIDDCIALGLTYVTNHSFSGNPQENSHTVMLSLVLRTLGGISVGQQLANAPNVF